MKFVEFLKKHKILSLAVVACIVLLVGVGGGVLIPMSMSDGVEKFEGEKKVVAQEELRAYIESSTTSMEAVGSVGVFKYRVERVEKGDVPTTGMNSWCKSVYRVYISEVTFFGIRAEPGYRIGCIKS